MFDDEFTLDPSPIHSLRLEHANGESLAVERVVGSGPTLVWLSGYGADMHSFKITWLTEQCRVWGLPLVKFDFRGTGQSSDDFAKVTFADWVADALQVIEQLTEGPVVLVGGSMGGWVALEVARKCDRVAAMILLCPAADFTVGYWNSLSAADRATCQREGQLILSFNDLPITYHFIQEAAQHTVLQGKIDFAGPVSLLHGMRDNAIPHTVSLQLVEALTTDDVTLHLIKDADHGLARPDDLVLLWQEITRMHDRMTEAAPDDENSANL